MKSIEASRGVTAISTELAGGSRRHVICLCPDCAKPLSSTAPWRAECQSDTYPDGDGGSILGEAWIATDGKREFKCDFQDEAEFLVSVLNSHKPGRELFSAQDIADACVMAEISDGHCESLLIALRS